MSWIDDFSFLLSPIELDISQIESDSQYGKLVDIHSKESFPDLEETDVAILGINEARRSNNPSISKGADAIRKHLYKLYHHGKSLKIADLGNIIEGEHPHDTDAAVKTVVKNLLEKNITVLILGGSQELTLSNYSAYEVLETTVNLAVVDSKIDLGEFRDNDSPNNFLSKIVLHDPSYLFNLSVLGNQTYLTDPAALELMDKLFFDSHRLGELTNDIRLCEPLLRNADVISFDTNAISSAFAPAAEGPNGFSGEQICQLSRYAGLSDKSSSIGFYNYDPENDVNQQTAKLLAEMLWCCIDGLSYRQKEFPLLSKKNFIEYKVHLPDGKDEIVFYKSQRTDKWWMNIPYSGGTNGKLGRHHLVPCSYSEYELATHGELPDMWWKTYQKLG